MSTPTFGGTGIGCTVRDKILTVVLYEAEIVGYRLEKYFAQGNDWVYSILVLLSGLLTKDKVAFEQVVGIIVESSSFDDKNGKRLLENGLNHFVAGVCSEYTLSIGFTAHTLNHITSATGLSTFVECCRLCFTLISSTTTSRGLFRSFNLDSLIGVTLFF